MVAGATMTAYLVPQVMAYAGLAGVPVQAGLWAAIVALPVYALLGTSRLLSAGPDATTALLTAAIIAPLAAGDGARAASLAALLAVIVGGYAVVAWALRLGFVGDFLSRAVLIGYLAGLGCILIASQLDTITGTASTGDGFASDVSSFAGALESIHLPSLAMGAGVALALIVLSPRFPRVPMTIIVVAIAAVLTTWLHLDGAGIATVGTLSFAWPLPPQLPSPSDAAALALPALGLFVVAFSGNLLTARSFSGGEVIEGNRELLALGATNIAVSAVHGMPVSSSASRSALARAAGGRTQLISLVAALGTLLALAFFGGVLATFPEPALGGLIVYAATKLISVPAFLRLWQLNRQEWLVAMAAFVGVLALGILVGVLAAVVLSLLQVLARVARPRAAVLGQPEGIPGWHDIADYPDAERIEGLVVFRYDSPLFFANARDFRDRAIAALDASPTRPRWLLLNMESNVTVDSTACDALDDLREECRSRGVVLALVRVKQSVIAVLDRHGVGLRIGADRMYPTLPTAVEAYERELER